MKASLIWKARPIFVSSTFRGMDAERDHLRDHAFLRLGEQLHDRCHYLDTIDLRQGVENASEADEAKREMQVLKVCLQEIERSKPFLVALLGERYGWIPPPERIVPAARGAGLPPTVDVAGKSVTELEILYAVLENPDQRKRGWFYFRTLDRTDMPPEVAARFPADPPSDDPASPAARLRALKERIRREMPGRVSEYTLRWDGERNGLIGLDALDDQVAADLWGDLDLETAAWLRAAPKTWQEADARGLADFVAERTRGYVERPAVTDPMLAHALSPASGGTGSTPSALPWGLVVTAESGAGKSSLFGRVYQSLQPRAESGDILLLAHAAGIFPQSGQVDRMLKRWVAEIAAYLGIPDPLDRTEQSPETRNPRPETLPPPITADEIDKTFASLLGQAAARTRVVVLVDALNQFEPAVRAEYLTWMPKLWPDNARFLATAIPCQATATLRERAGCRELPVPAITRPEATDIAQRYYRERHHRDVNPLVLAALLDKTTDHRSPVTDQPPPSTSSPAPAHANPPWLALALQEMNLLEADDYERADRAYAHLPGAERMQALQLDEARKLPADVPGVYGELLDRAGRGFGKAWADAFVNLIALGRAGWRESDLRALMPAVSGRQWDELAFAGLCRIFGTHVVQRGACEQWDFFHAALRATVLAHHLAVDATRRRLHGTLADHLLGLPPGDPLRISETMVHLIGHGDRDRAAEYLGACGDGRWTSPLALASAVSVIVQALQSEPGEAARELLTVWLADLMGGDDNARTGRVANAVIFDLNDALAVTGEARTGAPRFRLLQSAGEALARLAASDPSNAQWQRDLFVSYWRMADVAEKTGQGDAKEWWRKAYGQLAGMKARGIMLPADEQYLAALKAKAEGGDTASPVKPTTREPSLEELIDFAEKTHRWCLWDAAASAYERLLAAGGSLSEYGPKLVDCLLNGRTPPLPGTIRRANEVIAKLAEAGHDDVAASLRRIVAEKQATSKKTSWWRRLAGGGKGV